ncbi:MAG: DUF3365 domain-containing protein [Thermodesulfobacteriota bacterium]
MATNSEKKANPPLLWAFLLAALAWTLVITGLWAWSIEKEETQIFDLAKAQARAFFQEIVTTRSWNAAHGGVYVPVTPETQPNPYLEDPERDVVTTDGLRLTKINPAYMTQQIGEIAEKQNRIWFHITSLKPIRPGNRPDPWEAQALKAFESGAKERFELVGADSGGKRFRYMAPLLVEKPCLSCHAKQGYREGDLRGGISVTREAEDILAVQRHLFLNHTLGFGLLWLIGTGGLFWGWRRLGREQKQRDDLIAELRTALSEVKTLRGFIPICASCKKIRDDQGYWNQLEQYITEHSGAQFSHGICPDCMKKLYPDFKLKE